MLTFVRDGAGLVVPCLDRIGNAAAVAANMPAAAHDRVKTQALGTLYRPKITPVYFAFGTGQRVLEKLIDGRVLAGRQI